MAISYRKGDRAFVDKGLSSKCAGKQVKIIDILSDSHVRVVVIGKPGPIYKIPIFALYGYVPSVGDVVLSSQGEYTVVDVDKSGLTFRHLTFLQLLSADITQIIKRKGEQMLEYAVGDIVVMHHLKELNPRLRGSTVKIIGLSPIVVELDGTSYTTSSDMIAYYIPNVGDVVRIVNNPNDLKVTSSVSVSCTVQDPISGSDISVFCKDIIEILQRAEQPPSSSLYNVGDIVEPRSAKNYTNVPRLISAVDAKLGIKFKGSARFTNPKDFRLSPRSVPTGLVSITDNGYTYLIYDGDNFSKYLKDTYFITCHILHNMLNEPIEVDYVTKGLGAEIIYSNHGTKLDGSVGSAIKYINSVITR